jgi:hypothetical protein
LWQFVLVAAELVVVPEPVVEFVEKESVEQVGTELLQLFLASERLTLAQELSVPIVMFDLEDLQEVTAYIKRIIQNKQSECVA